MTEPTHLRSLQALELAVRTGSLKAAAEALNVTPAAVGQRIKQLEDYLGVDLLARGRSGIGPTPALVAALPQLSAAFSELAAVARALDFQRVHELHIVADSDWAELWLLPRLPRFRDAHPNTHFCINGLGDVPVRLGQADCEVWFGPPRDPRREDPLFHDYLVPVCSPEIARRIASYPPDDRLEGIPLLHLDCYRPDPDALAWPEWIRRHGNRRTAPDRGIRYRTLVNALEAVHSSAGPLIAGLALTASGRRSGQLQLPFPLAQGAWTTLGYRVGFRDSALRRSGTAQFRDWLLEEAQATERELQGLVAAN